MYIGISCSCARSISQFTCFTSTKVQSTNTDAGGGPQAPATTAPAPEAPPHTSVSAVYIYSRCHGVRQCADVC